MSKYLSLVIFVIVVAAVAASGAQFTPGAWYATLNKPSWTPPNWLFGPVWSMLYLMIAIAGWLVWRAEGVGVTLAVWAAQLAANAAWSWIMFGRHEIGLAMADITLMWVLITTFVVLTWTRHRTASLLFLPYWAWVSFASALNFALWRLNP
jgi:translocator protein